MRQQKGNDRCCHLYCDSDYAGNMSDFKSISGIAVIDQYGALIQWRSVKQPTVARSTADLEYTAVAIGVHEGRWLTALEEEIDRKPKELVNTLTIYNYDSAAVSALKESEYKNPSRKMGVLFHWLKEELTAESAKIAQKGTNEIKEDGFTKALVKVKHEEMVVALGMVRMEEVEED